MPNVSIRKLIGVVCFVAVAAGFVVLYFYVSRPSDALKIERVPDVDYFMGALRAEGGLFRYTGGDGDLECWLEQDTNGEKNRRESVPLSTSRLDRDSRFKYGLIGVVCHPGEQEEVWEIYQWAIWQHKNFGGTETRSLWKPAATFRVPLPKRSLMRVVGDGTPTTGCLMAVQGQDEQGRPCSATLKAGPLK